MKIKGVQELTLIDYPDKIACTIFLYGCNFRCGFCHNPELVIKDSLDEITEQNVLSFLEKRKSQLDGVCITGGEPLMTLDIDFLIKIKDMGYKIKIDTNGCFPEKLQEIIERNLVDYVAMDIKSSPDRYSEITNNYNIDLNKIEQSIKLIARQVENYEFRTTIIEGFHDNSQVRSIAQWLNSLIGKKPRLLTLQGFKNNGKFMDSSFSNLNDTGENFLREMRYSIKDMVEKIDIRV